MQETDLDHTLLQVFDALDVAVVVVQPDAEILHANLAHLKYFGLAAHKMIGRQFVEFVDPADMLRFETGLRRAVVGESVDPFALRLNLANGQKTLTNVSLTRLGGHGSILPPVALFLRGAEEILASELTARLLASIVEGSDDAIIGKTLDGVITSWNAAAEKMFGYTANQALGNSITMLFPVERLAEEAEIMTRIRRGEKVRHYEAKRLAKDGTVLDLSITVSPIHNATGHVIGASKIARDMRVERVRNDRLAVLASVYENCGEAIMILNSHGEFVEVNAGFTAITGFSEQDMMGRSFNAFRSGRQSPQVARRMIRDLRRDHICKGEIWTRRKDGSALAGFLTVTALPGTAPNKRYIAILADVTSLRLHQETLERLAHYDDLTGLPNRLLLHDRLDHALAQSAAQGREVTVAYLDIDGFKLVNDQHGHDTGDDVLSSLAQRMAACLLPNDTVARVGGDEFVVVLPQVRSNTDRHEVLDNLLRQIRLPVRRAGLEIRVGASIGVATCPPDQGWAEQLIRMADQAMYEAKRQGGNQIRHFDSDRQIREQALQALVAEVRIALDERQFDLHFQPKINLETGAIVGAEGLLRWMHPLEGLRLPGKFIPTLHGHPIVEDIGAFAVTRALLAISQFEAAGLPIPLSINVTARELRRTNYASYLRREAQRCQVKDRSLLQLELLETDALDGDQQIAATLARCHQDGFSLAIDDFGVGFASLSYLGKIPADTIKMDRSFTANIDSDEASSKIASAIVAMAAAFGKSVVAEGVETAAIARKLSEIGCHLAQGFAIAPAMPRSQFFRWAADWQKRLDGLDTPFLVSDLLVGPRDK